MRKKFNSGRKRPIAYDTPDQFDAANQSSGCLEMAIFAAVIAIIFWIITGCNNAHHMQKVYPKGYYSRFVFKANHDHPDTTISVVLIDGIWKTVKTPRKK